VQQRWRFSAVLVLLALPGGAAPSSEPEAGSVASSSVAAFPDEEAAPAARASAAAPVGVAAFADAPVPPADPALVLLARNPYSDVLEALPPLERDLENPYVAARLAVAAGFENPYVTERALANPYTDEVRLANPYTEDLRFQNPYTAARPR